MQLNIFETISNNLRKAYFEGKIIDILKIHSKNILHFIFVFVLLYKIFKFFIDQAI